MLTSVLVTTFLFSSLAMAVDANPNMDALLSSARILQDDGPADEFSFLMNYNLKMISCKAGEMMRNPETGEYEYSAVVFRLCPKNNCDSQTDRGCSSGYGNFVVGMNSFVQAYVDDAELYFDDAFRVDEFADCEEYKLDNGEGSGYYIGPACMDNGKDIHYQLFTDPRCTQVATNVTFEDISQGWTLPYGQGGLVPTDCQETAEYTGNGVLEPTNMVLRLYENSGKCETHMETFHYYGRQEGSCEYIQSLLGPPETLEECQSGCASNADCFGSLICYRREAGGGVPGCDDIGIVMARTAATDFYCVQPTVGRDFQSESDSSLSHGDESGAWRGGSISAGSTIALALLAVAFL